MQVSEGERRRQSAKNAHLRSGEAVRLLLLLLRRASTASVGVGTLVSHEKVSEAGGPWQSG